jgi:molybdate transport system regulatory protein
VSIPEFFAPWHVHLEKGDINPRRLRLLQAIDMTGSVAQAAKQIGMTYKAAWDAVEIMNNLAGLPLVICQHGGKGGGGATLTATGLQIVHTYEHLSLLQAKWLASLQQVDADVLPIIKRLTMKTSARNLFHGTIEKITLGTVNVEVVLKLQGDIRIISNITLDSLERMQLKEGSTAWALVKASWVLLAEPAIQGKTSARNCLCGTVSRVVAGPVNVEVIVELDGGNTVAAIITHESVETLGISVDKPICVLIKSSHVLLGVDD